MSKPFIKWAGGKRSMAALLASKMPEQIEHYIDPFLGGGALPLYLLAAGRIKKATLSDVCWPLVNTWIQVRDRPDALLESAKQYENTAEAYAGAVDRFRILSAPRDTGGDEALEAAGLLLYLNAAGFKGMYRTSAKNGFNVTFGHNKHLRLKPLLIREASRLLNTVEVSIVCASFEVALASAGRGSAVFADPPYAKLKPGSFTQYAGPFGAGEHRLLANRMVLAHHRGAICVSTNADTPEARAFYQDMRIEPMIASRRIRSGKGKGAQAAREILCTLGVPHDPADLALYDVLVDRGLPAHVRRGANALEIAEALVRRDAQRGSAGAKDLLGLSLDRLTPYLQERGLWPA
jgi:DNA adenine methylase